MTDFAAALRQFRLAHGLTQMQVGRMLRVGKQTVSNWECGRTSPWHPEETLEYLARHAPGRYKPRCRLIDKISDWRDTE